MLFAEHVAPSDTAEHFAFTIRYREGEDLALAPHTDASSATINLCLGRNFTGGGLTFHGTVSHPSVPGVAVVHRGMVLHEALPLLSGERSNLVIWYSGQDGYVRVAPYPPHERSTMASRWGATTQEEL
eukprot:Sspe_Gene.115821::Locus_103956_Transcript_1_1_Confidence_1.000_Length_483::g.115821::m.115821